MEQGGRQGEGRAAEGRGGGEASTHGVNKRKGGHREKERRNEREIYIEIDGDRTKGVEEE